MPLWETQMPPQHGGRADQQEPDLAPGGSCWQHGGGGDDTRGKISFRVETCTGLAN